MWENLIEQAQGALSVVLLAVFSSLAAVLIAFVYSVRDKALKWLESHITESQRNTLWKIAQEAFAHAEAAGLPEKGTEKLNFALGYASERLREAGIHVTTTEIRAAIEKACLEYNKAKSVEIKLDNVQ